jgi:hypothetical protein
MPMSFPSLFHLFLQLCACVGFMEIQLGNDIISIGPIRSDTIWREMIHEVNFTLVDVMHDRALFDFCDLSVYTREHIQPLLQAHFVTNDTRWAAVVLNKNKLRLPYLCLGNMRFDDVSILAWQQLLSPYIQQAGGIGTCYIYIYML